MSPQIYGTRNQSPQAKPNPNKGSASAPLSSDLSDGGTSTAAPAEDLGSVSIASSSSCGFSTNSYTMHGPPHALGQQKRGTASTSYTASTGSIASTFVILKRLPSYSFTLLLVVE